MINSENRETSFFSNNNNESVLSPDAIGNLEDNLIVARVWKPKNKEGNVVSVAEALAYGGSVGHVSLQLFSGHQHKLYFSFWPSENPYQPFQTVNAMMSTHNRDRQEEKGLADTVCYIRHLNAKKMMEAFFQHLDHTQSRPCYTLLPMANRLWRTVLWQNENSHNCCTLTLKLIEAGLTTLGTKNDTVRAQIEGIKNQLTQLDPLFFAEFFQSFSEREDVTFSGEQLPQRKQQYRYFIEKKLYDIAKEGLSAELLLYQQIYPEIYTAIETELLKFTDEARIKISKQFQCYADEGKASELYTLRHKYPRLYDNLKDDLIKRLQEAYKEIEASGGVQVKTLQAASQQQLEQGQAQLRQAVDEFIRLSKLQLQDHLQDHPDLDPNAHISYVTTVIDALRKQKFNQMMNEPKEWGLPSSIVPFIFDYFYEHPALLIASQYPDETKALSVSYLKNTPNPIHSSIWQQSSSTLSFLAMPVSSPIDPQTFKVALCAFIENLTQTLKPFTTLSPQAAANYASNLITAMRKRQMTAFFKEPEIYGIPAELCTVFIQKFQHHPILLQGESLPAEFLKSLEVALVNASLDAVRQLLLPPLNTEDEQTDSTQSQPAPGLR